MVIYSHSNPENKCQGDSFLSKLSVIDKEIRKLDTMGNEEVGYMSAAINLGESKNNNKFPHEVAEKLNGPTYNHPFPSVPRATAKINYQVEPSPQQGQCKIIERQVLNTDKEQIEFKVGLGKRSQYDEDSFSELPNKKHQVSSGEFEPSNLLAEAGTQPC